MIRGIRERWRQWKDRRQKQQELPGEYEALAREFGLLTAKCLAAQEEAQRERATAARLAGRLTQLQAQYAVDVPGLTPGEGERLAILSEECGEVIRAIGKIQRYGWESVSPFLSTGRTNRMALEREIGSLRAIVNLMLDSQDMRMSELQSWQRTKKLALAKWTLYQGCSMPREQQLVMIRTIQESAGD